MRSTSTAQCLTSWSARRNGNAAKRFFRRLLKGLHYVPRVIVTDKLASYQVLRREMLASVEHRRSKYLNNGADRARGAHRDGRPIRGLAGSHRERCCLLKH
ncbi:DDE-type integrase/transposase/recombinase [Rhodococcus sp. IEGM 1379]|uniref:DDE-type integrase/transposase/recombinase n=1 Tax=Rhodococcus sp. IEGM 1379 TaxID=3047086 RepID=UPI0024B78113|nr:DDE-type integrase/transposase/recombinase [Rhodococcus sp. IEGM 1379]MDI9917302.1 DDE-type integrase/transposase/recombinase [Rhodococcus sp. IEGM 1379]